MFELEHHQKSRIRNQKTNGQNKSSITLIINIRKGFWFRCQKDEENRSDRICENELEEGR